MLKFETIIVKIICNCCEINYNAGRFYNINGKLFADMSCNYFVLAYLKFFNLNFR